MPKENSQVLVNISEEEISEMQKTVHFFFQEGFDRFLKISPVALRVSYFLNTLNKVDEKFSIDWNLIYGYLRKYPFPNDFNNFEKPNSIEDLIDISHKIALATFNFEFWRKETCIDCHKTFYLSKSEIDFFLDRNLYLPKRCKECRNSRRNSFS